MNDLFHFLHGCWLPLLAGFGAGLCLYLIGRADERRLQHRLLADRIRRHRVQSILSRLH